MQVVYFSVNDHQKDNVKTMNVPALKTHSCCQPHMHRFEHLIKNPPLTWNEHSLLVVFKKKEADSPRQASAAHEPLVHALDPTCTATRVERPTASGSRRS